MKVALYARVSTQEQAKYGLSIETQLENLRDWAKENNHIVVGEYVDKGVSGGKPYTKRPELSRFMADVEHGLKVDALIITKLDRLYRNVKLYYQAMEVLDKYRVGWICIHENYEVMTASGRLRLNIALAVAEDEISRTSERIKVVFDRKVQRGEVLGGMSVMPLGYRVDGKKPVLDENAEAVKAMFDYYLANGSIHAAMDYMREEWNISIVMSTARKMLRNQAYTGVYRDNPEYFPVIVPKDKFDEVQKMLKSRSVRKNHTNRYYLFSGLIVCKECGRNMVGAYRTAGNSPEYYGYRCQRAFLNHLCVNRHYLSEKKLEQWLIANLESEFGRITVKKEPKKRKKKVDTASIKRKLERLKDLYVDGLIDKQTYLEDYKKLQGALQADIEPLQADIERVKNYISESLTDEYWNLTRQEKQAVWRSIIEKIEVDADKNTEIFFRL